MPDVCPPDGQELPPSGPIYTPGEPAPDKGREEGVEGAALQDPAPPPVGPAPPHQDPQRRDKMTSTPVYIWTIDSIVSRMFHGRHGSNVVWD